MDLSRNQFLTETCSGGSIPGQLGFLADQLAVENASRAGAKRLRLVGTAGSLQSKSKAMTGNIDFDTRSEDPVLDGDGDIGKTYPVIAIGVRSRR